MLHQIHNAVLPSSSCLDSLDIGQLETQIYKPNTEKKKILCKTNPLFSIGDYSQLGNASRITVRMTNSGIQLLRFDILTVLGLVLVCTGILEI